MKSVQSQEEANVVLIPTEGEKKFWYSDEELSIEKAYEIGSIDRGYVQLVELPGGEGGPNQMLIHEEGKLRGLPNNPEATLLFIEAHGPFDIIVGPALILSGKARWT